MLPAARTARRLAVAVLAGAVAVVVAGCALLPTDRITGHRGGTLTVLNTGEAGTADPGQAYSDPSYELTAPTQRTLYGFDPARPGAGPVGDLAAGVPQISDNSRRVEILLRPGVHYSPPVDREIRSGDVKYAIERGFTRRVETPYATAYLGDIAGVPAFRAGRARHIAGIETPNDGTLVFHLTRSTGRLLANAMTMPISSPVPPEYARRFDRGPVSTYGAHAVATGPYMVAPGARTPTRVDLVRNPNWKSGTDYRPAFLDRIVVRFDAGRPAPIARAVLAGRGMIAADFFPPPDVLRAALRLRPAQVVRPTSSDTRWVALNTRVAPFHRLDVRRAVAAQLNPIALRRAYGGDAYGELATHFIPPGVPGFDAAGGHTGPPLLELTPVGNDPALARRFMVRAGYPGGRYTGPPVSMVGSNAPQPAAVANEVRRELGQLGIPVRLRSVPFEQMYALCSTPAARIAVCPNVTWQADFPDAETIFAPTFDGASIQPRNNTNWSLFDDPRINAQIGSASTVTGQADRGEAWGGVDRAVAGQAPAVPWMWDRSVNIRSANVKGVINPQRAVWDVAFTSLR
jgi:peptide/nickel transport system substrate-binding protein